MTQEDIIEIREQNMPQWRKDQIDATNGNVDYVNTLKRKIERLEENLKSHNKDYAAALNVLDEYIDNEEAVQSVAGFFAWLHERLNSED